MNTQEKLVMTRNDGRLVLGGVLLVMALVTTNLLGGLVNLLWPLALVLLGSGLLLRNYLRSNMD